ncbi:MAG: amino acid adenylation domain-containing protein, partial [Cyanobacteria bacterium P01_A01_bin.137]
MSASEQQPKIIFTHHSIKIDSELNDIAATYPTANSIHEQFQLQVKHYPEKVAVSIPTLSRKKTNTLTYQELDRRSSHLACDLRKRGLKPGDFVAICLNRSLEMVVAILGILKAGGAYVPLDPAYPEDRLAFMLADAAAPLILTQESLRSKLPKTDAIILHLETGWGADAPRDVPATAISTSPDALAYVNYTSGSTGQPKGVAVPHQGVLRLVLGADYTPLDSDRVLLQLAPISFDAATLELWGALLNGGHCVLFPGSNLPDPRELEWVLREYGVTTLWLTASLFNTLIMDAPEVLAPVQELLTGGEALSVPHIRRAQALLPETQLINGYGPTESTTFTCCYRIPRTLPADCTNIPIGYPINRTQIYILDEQQQPVPPGQPGELYIGGDGLAQGYLNLPEKTAERFVPNPFATNLQTRLYRTGDMVQQRPDGAIEFLGRQDNQVKLRGFRIELGEIEAALMAADHVKTALVLLREDTPGRKRLVAYVTADNSGCPAPEALKAGLQNRLAAYMVPEAILVLNQIPLTPNGKADRRALPVPPETLVSDHVSTLAPQTELEATLAAIWAAVLEVPAVGTQDNFFDMGGTSLLGMQVALRIQQQISADFRVVKLYEHPTIGALAQYLAVGAATALTPIAAEPNATTEGIAIVGMAGRFPGADSVDGFWQNLCNGVESHTVFSLDQLDPSIPTDLRQDPNYVPVRGIVDNADQFDAAFFGISPREAEVMDPQARVFLEVVYEALENAGYSP